MGGPSPIMQLTIEGDEVPHDRVLRTRRATLTPQQREIMRMTRAKGSLRASEAGRVMHAYRGYCEFKAADYPLRSDTVGCCAYCAADGWSALKRLRDRGFLVDIDHEWVTMERHAEAINAD